MSMTQKYAAALVDVEAWSHEKRKRENSLRTFYRNQAIDDVSIGALIDKDQLVQEAQLLLDRAIAKAAAFGPGAIIEQLRSQRS